MSALSDCRDYLIQIVGSGGGVNSPATYIATVNTVNEAARTCSCTLVNGPADVSLDTVLLMSEVNDGMLIIPSEGSTVIIQSTPNSLPVIIMFSEIDKVISVAGGSTFQIDSDGIKLDGIKYGGIAKIIDPDNSNAGVLARLNKIENAFNDFINNDWNPFATTYVPGSPSTTGLPATLATSTVEPITPTQQSDIENTKVKHGDGS